MFALTSAVIDENDNPDVPHTGFDVDGFASSDVEPLGCTHLDYVSYLDPEQNCSVVAHERCVDSTVACTCAPFALTAGRCLGTVDNQLPTGALVLLSGLGIDLRRASNTAMAAGRFVVLVQLLGVDDLANDPAIRARLFRGFAAPATACTTPFAGGIYQIDRASLLAGGSAPSDAAVELTGSIVNGRLRVSTGDAGFFPLRWPVERDAVPPMLFDTHHATLAMDLTADLGTRGNFGGWVDASRVIEWFARSAPDYVSVVRGVLGGLVDIQVNGVCDGTAITPPAFGGISIGFGFDAVRVQLDPVNPVADAATLPHCEPVETPDAAVDADAADAPTDAGLRFYGRCTTNAQCGAGGRCLTQFPGGLCTRSCTNDRACGANGMCETNLSMCLPTCMPGNADCDQYGGSCIPADNTGAVNICIWSCYTAAATNAPRGYPMCPATAACDPYSGACGQMPPTGAEDGGPCAADADCKGGRCITELDSGTGEATGWVGGYCISFARQAEIIRGQPVPQGNCPTGAGVVPMNGEGPGDGATCFATCDATHPCRGGYQCDDLTPASGTGDFFSNGICLPVNCLTAGMACPANYHCVIVPVDGGPPDGRCEASAAVDGGVDVVVTDAAGSG